MRINIIAVVIATTILSVILATGESNAASTIDRVTDDDGVVISSISPGDTIMISGSGFGRTRGHKSVTFFSGRPEEFYVDLEIINWSETGDTIVARIPSYSSDCYRVTPDYLEMRPLPDRIISALPQSGYLMITNLRGGAYEQDSNWVTFILEPAPTPALVMARPLATTMSLLPALSHPCCKALHAPERAVLACPTGSPPVIDSVEPTRGFPGTYVEIIGNCFGVRESGDNVMIRASDSHLNYLMLRDIVSWSNNRIVARIPAPDLLWRVSGGGYAVYTIYERPEGAYPIALDVIADMNHTEHPGNFVLTYAAANEPPTLCTLNPATVVQRACFMIEGTEFGPSTSPGRVFIKKAGGRPSELTGALWSSATIRVCVPRSLLAGPYKIYISRPNDMGIMVNSNELDLNVTGVGLFPTFRH